jgi:multisite-specific tRNA:(cytosine-C5)-methyltransferase
MLPKEERKAMLLRIYNDNSPLIDHNKERNMKPQNPAPEESVKALNGEEKSAIESSEAQNFDAEGAEDIEHAKPEENGGAKAEVGEADDADDTATRDVEMEGGVSS